MRARFGSDPTAGSKILSFKFISRYTFSDFYGKRQHFLNILLWLYWEFIPNYGCINRESTLAQVQLRSVLFIMD